MTTAEILKKVRKIEIKTRGLSNHIFAGEYHAHFKGRGMSFSEVREYTPGDDVKTIDWNVTARLRHPYVKVFEEERELTVMLMVDVSASSLFGTQQRLKQELITELSAVLAFSATTNNDKVGVIFFSDRVEKYIPPKKGRSHILRIIRELIALTPGRSNGTQVHTALEFLNNVQKKKTIAFLLSDFVSAPFDKAIQLAARKHDLIGLHIFDPADKDLPDAGLVQLIDSETGFQTWVDTGDRLLRQRYTRDFEERRQYCQRLFKRSGASLVSLRTDQDFVKPLQSFFLGR